jgi:Uma2 family endonuclease
MSVASDNWIRRHRITVDEYYRMAEVGLLAADARTELIEGEIIDMAPIGDKHADTVDRLNMLLVRSLADSYVLGVQRPIRLGTDSEPQPDLVIYKPNPSKRGHPTPGDILLVVEVSDSTLRYDRERKLPLYAQHGIPETWLIDVQKRELVRLSEPCGSGYLKSESLQSGTIQPLLLPEVKVELDKFLPL